jgi:predicted TIM-barrel enzyme
VTRIAEVFGVRRVLLPVVHPVSRDEALASVDVTVQAGVKGVFVINQGMSEKQVLALMMEIRGRHPTLWVGVNLLGFSPEEILERGLEAGDGRLDGIWSDNAHIDEDAAQQPQAAAFVAARREVGWTGLYFGGVAFKYQREVVDEKLEWAARVASGYMDVVCTSGPGTGHEARVEKVAAMRAGLGPDSALALASGVTPENVGTFLPYVDAYLVGTGIEARLGVLDAERVRALQGRVSA